MHRSACDSCFIQALLLKLFFFPFFPSSQRCWLSLIVWIIDFVISCVQPYCSLHLHLHVSANPYTSGNIASRESAPGIIVASGEWEGNLSRAVCFFSVYPNLRGVSPTPQKTPKQNNTLVSLSDLLMLINEYIFTRCSNIFFIL